MPKLILIRGLPGSGKSTLAKEIAKFGMVHLEADMYFVKDDKYTYDRDQIKAAHEWCQKATMEALKENKDVVISNTFVKLWEMDFYYNLAKEFNADILVVRTWGKYKNEHGIPDEITERMKNNFEDAYDEVNVIPQIAPKS